MRGAGERDRAREHAARAVELANEHGYRNIAASAAATVDVGSAVSR